MRLRLPLFFRLLAMLCAGAGLLSGQTILYSGVSNNRFFTGNSWVGGVAPGATNTAQFGDHGVNSTVMVNNGTVGSIEFLSTRTATYVLSYDDGVSTLTLNGNLTAQTGPNVGFSPFLNLALSAGEHVFDIGTGTSATIAGVISGTGHFTKTGAGTLVLTGANTFNYNGGFGFLNSSVIHQGTVTLQGGAINHGTSGDIWVGQFSGDSGILNITSGGLASGYFGVMGHDAGSTGTATVSGAGSTWTNSNGMSVGSSGTGTLTISNSGAVSVTGLNSYIAANASSTGTATVDGAGSSWTNASGLNVGNSGDGTLNITNGGNVTNTFGYIATQSGSIGSVTVSGAGSTWLNSGLLAVGQGGTGSLSITNGGVVSNTFGEIGYSAGSAGTVLVSGTGSAWTNSNTVNVGNAGTGALTLADSGLINVNAGAGTINLGASGGSGTLNIGAAAANTAAAGGMVNAASITTGTGSGIVQFKTTATSGSPYYLTKDGTAGGTAVPIGGTTQLLNNAGYTVLTGVNTYTGGTRINNGTLVVSGTGSVTHGAATTYVGYSNGDIGSLLVTGGGDFTDSQGQLGLLAGSDGAVTVSGAGSTWTNTNYLYVGLEGFGALDILSGASVSSPNTSIGNNTGGEGEVVVNGAGSLLANTGTLYVGSAGLGYLEISNGASATNVTGSVGNNAGGAGNVYLDSGGTWTNTGSLIVGNADSGDLYLYGASTVTAANATIGALSGVFGSVSVNHSGSTFGTTGNLVIGGTGDGVLEIRSGGAAVTGGLVTLGNAAGGFGWGYVDALGSTWTVAGGLTVGNNGAGELHLTNSGLLSVNAGGGTVTLGANAAAGGRIYFGEFNGEGGSAAGLLDAALITTGGGLGKVFFESVTSTSAAPFFLTKDGTALGAPVIIGGSTLVEHNYGYTVLAGANTYTGGTTINAGTLVMGNNTALGTGSVTLNGGTLHVAPGITFGNALNIGVNGGRLAGSGSFGSPLTLGAGVSISPGSSPGTANFLAGLTLNDGGTLEIEVRAVTGSPGTDWDFVNVTGVLDLSGLSTGGYTLKAISLSLADAPNQPVSGLTNPTSWTIATASGGITGFQATDFTFDLSQFYGGGFFTLSQSGNDLLLNFAPVPEPSTYALMLAGLALGGLHWRRRRNRA